MLVNGYDGKKFMLVNKESLVPVEKGDELVDFRGETGVLESGRAPHKPSSQGHVSVKRLYCDHAGESYASVFGLKWVEVK